MIVNEIKDWLFRSGPRGINDPDIEDVFPQIYENEDILLQLLASDFSADHKLFIVLNIVNPVFWSLSSNNFGEGKDFQYPESFSYVQRFMYSQPLTSLLTKTKPEGLVEEKTEVVKVLKNFIETGKIRKFEDQPEYREMLRMLIASWNELRKTIYELNEIMDD